MQPIVPTSNPTPSDAVDAYVPLSALRDLARVSLFAALMGVGALAHIPIGPVPFTLQTCMVLLSGFMLGSRRAALAAILYTTAGVIGLPVFGRGRVGPASVLGPSGGYLLAFVFEAAIAGFAVRFSGKMRYAAMLVFGVLGTLAMLAVGATWLHMVLIPDLDKALLVGLYPFIPIEAVKIILAAAAASVFHRDWPAEDDK